MGALIDEPASYTDAPAKPAQPHHENACAIDLGRWAVKPGMGWSGLAVHLVLTKGIADPGPSDAIVEGIDTNATKFSQPNPESA